jgi:hypothetical protein
MSQPQSTPLFRTSLRSWQASYKASQAQAEAAPAEGQPAAVTPTRVKRLAPHRRRAQRQAAGRGK